MWGKVTVQGVELEHCTALYGETFASRPPRFYLLLALS